MPTFAEGSAALVARAIDGGWIPERVLRMAIRRLCAQRLRECERGGPPSETALIAELGAAPIAIATEAANAQHYEVDAAFFAHVLGPHRKYSSGYWPAGVASLGEAEAAMLALSAARAGLEDGQEVLDLGCGWGAMTGWAARRYPRSRITAVSNSRAQRAAIEEMGLGNVEVITGDVRALQLERRFDRVVSIEMFEHMRNHGALLAKIAGWLRPGGALFVHVFAHRRHVYTYDDAGPGDWMAREFFTGGMMPSFDLLPRLDRDLRVRERWWIGGEHYARTAEAWHDNLWAGAGAVREVLGGGSEGRRRFQRWRVFFLACAEMFGYRGGREWGVAHYRLER